MDIVVLSTADWDHPFWTNKQHVSCSLVRFGHRVLYIESPGLRPIRVEASDLRRVWKRLFRAFSPPRRVDRNLWVCSPLLIPAARGTMARALNYIIFQSFLFVWRSFLGWRNHCLWTYLPTTLDYLSPSSFERSVYHCVDDISAQPCMSSAYIQKREISLCRRVNQVFTTSPSLYAACVRWNKHCKDYGNVADVNHFARARLLRDQGSVPSDLADITGPILMFIGAISGYKLDFELISQTAEACLTWTFVMIGRIGEGDPETYLDAIKERSNIRLIGPRCYHELPGYLASADMAWLPCKINRYTTSMFPMKFFEYLSAGCSVISTPLPALQSYQQWYHQISTSQDCVNILNQWDRSKAKLPPTVEELNANHSYDQRTNQMLEQL